jgi:hypothetical protein
VEGSEEYLVQGSFTVQAQLPGNSELVLTLKKGNEALPISREGLSPLVTVFEMERHQKRFKIRTPLEPFIPYTYNTALAALPVVGCYQMKAINTTKSRFLLQIRVQTRLQSLSLRLSFPHRERGIRAIESTPTEGSCAAGPDGHSLVWSFGKPQK